jgi:hypothetical protein
MDLGFQVAYAGSQFASLPGPVDFPVDSKTVRMPLRTDLSYEAPVDIKTQEILKTIQIMPDALNSAFFSSENIQYLQFELVREVARVKKVQIQMQSERDLVLIMRSMYMMLRSSQPTLEVLNKRTLQAAMESISANLDMYKVYVTTEERSKQVMDWGINTSIKGTKFMY